jgi:hypothetical protein
MTKKKKSEKKEDDVAPLTDIAPAPKARRVRKPRPTASDKRHAKEKRIEVSRETIAELEGLRRTLEEISERYQLRVSGQFAELVSILEAGLNADDRTAPASATLAVMLDRIHKTELKPRKGRAKDLVRLQDLAGELTEMLLQNPLD